MISPNICASPILKKNSSDTHWIRKSGNTYAMISSITILYTGNTHSMEKVPSMENVSIYQTEYYIKHEVFGKKFLEKHGKSP